MEHQLIITIDRPRGSETIVYQSIFEPNWRCLRHALKRAREHAFEGFQTTIWYGPRAHPIGPVKRYRGLTSKDPAGFPFRALAIGNGEGIAAAFSCFNAQLEDQL